MPMKNWTNGDLSGMVKAGYCSLTDLRDDMGGSKGAFLSHHSKQLCSFENKC